MGSLGKGVNGFVSGSEPLRYVIFFENIETATAPAQEVRITDQLDPAVVDLNTLNLGAIAFGDTIVMPPPGVREFEGILDLRPSFDLMVQVVASLDAQSGLVAWRLLSLDPDTGRLPEDPLAGFLPPNVRRCSNNPDMICSPSCSNDPDRRCSSETPCVDGGDCEGLDEGRPCQDGQCIGNGEGEGSVSFTIVPREGLRTGTVIENQATIIFDTNEPITTDACLDDKSRVCPWFNTIDSNAPESRVLDLSAEQSSLHFPLSWEGRDDDGGAGVWNYTVYASRDGDPFEEFLVNTTATSGVFAAKAPGTYSFYSVARDMTGNVENPPQAPDSTDIVPDATTIVIGGKQRGGDCNQDGTLDISDALCVFGVLFLGQPEAFPCGDGSPGGAGNLGLLDWQPDGGVDISDSIGILRHLFLGAAGHPFGAGCVPISGCPDECGT